MLLVPLGTLLEPGSRVTIVPQDLWEKFQRHNEWPDVANRKNSGSNILFAMLLDVLLR
jgi:hypothetical protein